MFDVKKFISGLFLKGNMVLLAHEMGKISDDEAELLCKTIPHMDGFEVAEACGLKPVPEDDPGLTSLIISFIATERKAVMDYRSGDDRAINHIIGKVLSKMPEVDPRMAREMIEDRILDDRWLVLEKRVEDGEFGDEPMPEDIFHLINETTLVSLDQLDDVYSEEWCRGGNSKDVALRCIRRFVI